MSRPRLSTPIAVLPPPGRLARIAALGLCLLAATSPARAEPVDIPDGECAVIVASRRSMAEVRDFIRANPDAAGETPSVYLSRNGWHAISRGLLRQRGADGVLDQAKRNGLIPRDAYCSTGRVYTSRIPLQATSRNPVELPPDSLVEEVPATRDAATLDPRRMFDARPLPRDDKRALQAALALSGDYTGLLDGQWGRGSQAALDTWSQRRMGRDARMGDVMRLGAEARTILRDGGWRMRRAADTGLSLALPTARLRPGKRDGDGLGESWEDPATGLSFQFGTVGDAALRRIHARFAEAAEGGRRNDPPYMLRRADRWVSSGTLGRGLFYLRSDRRAGGWGTVVVYGPSSAKPEIGLVASSIREGGPVALEPDPGGPLDLLIDRWNGVAPRDPAPTVSPRVPEPAPAPRNTGGTGTGFLINSSGVYLTNAHVVEGCRALSVNGIPARLMAESAGFDLAAVEAIMPIAGARPLPIADRPAGLNSDVTIAGYPLHGLLGGLNVQRGSVAGLRGPGGDDRLIQISAPVQAGNSGGPVIDNDGAVVGVVVAKLDARKVVDALGDMPQNVNFAIRGALARSFLEANGIPFRRQSSAVAQTRAEAAAALDAATALLECLP